jgi:hypothetical protein
MELVQLPFTQGMMVQVLCKGVPVDRARIDHILFSEEKIILRLSSQGFRPGDTATYMLIRGKDPESESWGRLNTSILGELCDEALLPLYRFCPLKAYA